MLIISKIKLAFILEKLMNYIIQIKTFFISTKYIKLFMIMMK